MMVVNGKLYVGTNNSLVATDCFRSFKAWRRHGASGLEQLPIRERLVEVHRYPVAIRFVGSVKFAVESGGIIRGGVGI